jgi:hypothetical protein
MIISRSFRVTLSTRVDILFLLFAPPELRDVILSASAALTAAFRSLAGAAMPKPGKMKALPPSLALPAEYNHMKWS